MYLSPDPDAIDLEGDGPLEGEGYEDMGQLLDSVEAMKPIRRGDVVEGVIMSVESDGLHVNFGHKSEGFVPSRELRTAQSDGGEPLKVGDDIVTVVIRNESGEQPAILSLDRAVGEKGWRVLAKFVDTKESVRGTVLGFNRGGAIVEVEGVHGFVPASQLVSISRDRFRDQSQDREQAERQAASDTGNGAPAVLEAGPDGVAERAPTPAPSAEEPDAGAAAAPESEAKPESELEAGTPEASAPESSTPESSTGAAPEAETKPDEAETKEEAPEQAPEPEPKPEEEANADIGRVLDLKVLEVNRSRNRAIFSERQFVEEIRNERKARLIEELKEGEVRRGRVTGISSFGAFVDMGGADGLVHISEMSWGQVDRPEQVVAVGQELDVYVLRVDPENKKIALSLKRLQPEPWETIHEKLTVNDVVDATITKLTNFGAFARVEGSVEGLVHISELTDRVVQHPREVVREGDKVRLKVLRIEPERRRLGLSLKQAEGDLFTT
jgi:ribosomal protein S1